MSVNKKEAIREYKMSHRPMGVFQIRNKTNGKVFIDSSNNIPGKINRHTFALNAGQHASESLQADWNEFGESAFDSRPSNRSNLETISVTTTDRICRR